MLPLRTDTMTSPTRAWLRIAAVAGLLCANGGCGLVAKHYMNVALTTGPNGTDTPTVPFEHVQIKSGDRRMDAFLVRAPEKCADAPALVVYHGVKETISMWTKAQQFLYAHCVSSVVFDYPGSGDSSRPADFDDVSSDCAAVFDYARLRFPHARLFVLGHSMGNAPMLAAMPQFSGRPDGIIIGNAFSSTKEVGKKFGGFYAMLAELSPDFWNNVKSVRMVKGPILVVHSDADKVNPLSDGKEIFAEAPEPKQMVTVHGTAHNDLYKNPSELWWSGPLTFMGTLH